MLELPDVTVVCIDNIAHDLAVQAIEDTLRVIRPHEVLFYTDRDFHIPNCHNLYFSGSSVSDADQLLWYVVPHAVVTSHLLTIQWDGWALNTNAWTDEFLKYDYIGAPWHWHPAGQQVGNGGFSLRSTRLMRYLADHQDELPYLSPDDDTLCRRYRNQLEFAGFQFAPLELAMRFAFEHGQPPFPTFGFHDIRNWPRILTDEQIDQRLSKASSYVRGKTDLLRQMFDLRDKIRNAHSRC